MRIFFVNYKKPTLCIIIFLSILCTFSGIYLFASFLNPDESKTTNNDINTENTTYEMNTTKAAGDEAGERLGISLISDPQTDWEHVSEIKIHSYSYHRNMENPLIISDPAVIDELIKYTQSTASYYSIKPEDLFVEFAKDIFVDFGNGVVIAIDTNFENCMILDNREADSSLYYHTPQKLLTKITNLLLEDMHTPPEDSAYHGQYYDYSHYCFYEKHDGTDFIDRCYTLEDSIVSSILGSETSEDASNLEPAVIEIYTGNAGDGDSGYVLIKDADGRLIYDEFAHSCRAGWNTIYLCENKYLMTIHLEDRYDYGNYNYNVFRLDNDGNVIDIHSDSFEWTSSSYDDEQFKQWADGLNNYLSKSYLLLSTQDDNLRTEQVCDKDLYCYETLKPTLE